jgi:hypothetical protein
MIAREEIGLNAVDRILDAVGRKHVPIDINIGELHAGLVSCLATYYAALERSSDKHTRDKIARLEKILVPAKRLQAQLPLLPEDDVGFPFREPEYFANGLENFVFALESKIDDLKFELRNGPDFDEALALHKDPKEYADRWKARSPFEWLAGYYLPQLFRKKIGLPLTFHRRAADNAPEGPLIRFIEAALVEFEITRQGKRYSREAIAKAVSDARTNRVRKLSTTLSTLGKRSKSVQTAQR